jgi:hypothetical protein
MQFKQTFLTHPNILHVLDVVNRNWEKGEVPCPGIGFNYEESYFYFECILFMSVLELLKPPTLKFAPYSTHVGDAL